MLLLESTKAMLALASKKGIAITAAIAAGIVGASFLIWLIPQSSPGAFIGPRSDEDVLSDVFSRHNDLAADVDSKYEQWKAGSLASDDMLARINSGNTEASIIQTELEGARPAQEWKESYGLYTQALDSFKEYLNAMKVKVEQGDKEGDGELSQLKLDWQGYVNDSVSAMPISR